MPIIENFNRAETFQRYQKMNNPFIILTVPLNITPLVEYTQKHHHFNCLFGYIIRNTVNEVPAFRYRYIDNKFYFFDKVDISYTEFINENVVFFDCHQDDMPKFIEEYDKEQAKVKELNKSTSTEKNDVIWVSCLPWMKFTSLIPPFNKEITIPQFIWDKYEKVGDEYHCNLMIMIHHGFADGYQVYEFVNKLEQNINKIKNY